VRCLSTYSSWQGSVSKGNLTHLHKALAVEIGDLLSECWLQLLQILKELSLCLSNICFVSKEAETLVAHVTLQLKGESQEAANGSFFSLASESLCPMSDSNGWIGPNPSALYRPVLSHRKTASVVQALILVSFVSYKSSTALNSILS